MTTPINQETHFNVVILGGGPSGTAAGITLLKRDGISVAIIEKSDYSSSRIGESLTPGMRPLLEYLNVWEQFRREQSLESFGSRAAWGSSSAQSLDYMFTLHGTGWALNRANFDKMLARTFEERGGSLFTKTRFIGLEPTSNNNWEVHIKTTEGASRKITAEYLIDATGRLGLLGKRVGSLRTIYDKLVGVGCIGQLPSHTSLEAIIEIEACQYGWWYTSPIPGNMVSVVLISDADIISRQQATDANSWQVLLNKMELTKKRVANARFTQKPKVFPCFSSCLQQVGGENWVAVGDAVASHDPLSSSGIPHAIGSGVHGALVAADALFSNGELLEHYQQSIHKDFLLYLNTHWQYYQREARWPESLFWKRRRTLIWVDPEAMITSINPLPKPAFHNLAHLSTRFSQNLYQQCQSEQCVHQVVRKFANAHPQLPDQQIILAFQELVEKDYVKINNPKYATDKSKNN